ncbi:ASPIC/UnbV domain-containing protein, partial [bacterium]|nr:ASPIC/UnbV domain-containing protein [bacterium]
IIMGLGASNQIDSLLIEWPNGSVERQGAIQANQFLKLWMPIQQQPAKKQSKPHLKKKIFQEVTTSLGIDYGTVLLNTREGWEVASSTAMGLYLEGQIVQMEPIMIAKKRAFIVVRNDATIQIFNY